MKRAPLLAAATVLIAFAAGARADDLDKQIPAATLDPANSAASETAVVARPIADAASPPRARTLARVPRQIACETMSSAVEASALTAQQRSASV